MALDPTAPHYALGPGGVGKTRLALELGRAIADEALCASSSCRWRQCATRRSFRRSLQMRWACRRDGRRSAGTRSRRLRGSADAALCSTTASTFSMRRPSSPGLPDGVRVRLARDEPRSASSQGSANMRLALSRWEITPRRYRPRIWPSFRLCGCSSSAFEGGATRFSFDTGQWSDRHGNLPEARPRCRWRSSLPPRG
jgi:hypothetical protein